MGFERQQDLRQNFSCGQIPNQSELRREAKMAIHGAACLRGNADRLPSLARHEHRFHRCRLPQAARLFFSALLCALCVLCELCVKCFDFFRIPQP